MFWYRFHSSTLYCSGYFGVSGLYSTILTVYKKMFITSEAMLIFRDLETGSWTLFISLPWLKHGSSVISGLQIQVGRWSSSGFLVTFEWFWVIVIGNKEVSCGSWEPWKIHRCWASSWEQTWAFQCFLSWRSRSWMKHSFWLYVYFVYWFFFVASCAVCFCGCQFHLRRVQIFLLHWSGSSLLEALLLPPYRVSSARSSPTVVFSLVLEGSFDKPWVCILLQILVTFVLKENSYWDVYRAIWLDHLGLGMGFYFHNENLHCDSFTDFIDVLLFFVRFFDLVLDCCLKFLQGYYPNLFYEDLLLFGYFPRSWSFVGSRVNFDDFYSILHAFDFFVLFFLGCYVQYVFSQLVVASAISVFYFITLKNFAGFLCFIFFFGSWIVHLFGFICRFWFITLMVVLFFKSFLTDIFFLLFIGTSVCSSFIRVLKCFIRYFLVFFYRDVSMPAAALQVRNFDL